MAEKMDDASRLAVLNIAYNKLKVAHASLREQYHIANSQNELAALQVKETDKKCEAIFRAMNQKLADQAKQFAAELGDSLPLRDVTRMESNLANKFENKFAEQVLQLSQQLDKARQHQRQATHEVELLKLSKQESEKMHATEIATLEQQYRANMEAVVLQNRQLQLLLEEREGSMAEKFHNKEKNDAALIFKCTNMQAEMKAMEEQLNQAVLEKEDAFVKCKEIMHAERHDAETARTQLIASSAQVQRLSDEVERLTEKFESQKLIAEKWKLLGEEAQKREETQRRYWSGDALAKEEEEAKKRSKWTEEMARGMQVAEQGKAEAQAKVQELSSVVERMTLQRETDELRTQQRIRELERQNATLLETVTQLRLTDTINQTSVKTKEMLDLKSAVGAKNTEIQRLMELVEKYREEQTCLHVKIAALTERWKEVQIKEAELRATLRARDLEVHKLELSVQTERIQVNEQDQELLAMAKKCEQHQQMQQSLINEHQAQRKALESKHAQEISDRDRVKESNLELKHISVGLQAQNQELALRLTAFTNQDQKLIREINRLKQQLVNEIADKDNYRMRLAMNLPSDPLLSNFAQAFTPASYGLSTDGNSASASSSLNKAATDMAAHPAMDMASTASSSSSLRATAADPDSRGHRPCPKSGPLSDKMSYVPAEATQRLGRKLVELESLFHDDL